ncbi:hypothetical protein Ddc_12992 [Ditylenchus destructor]|nr:hypothetical protein Ddc_12992 [Ditylenchus destructor]
MRFQFKEKAKENGAPAAFEWLNNEVDSTMFVTIAAHFTIFYNNILIFGLLVFLSSFCAFVRITNFQLSALNVRCHRTGSTLLDCQFKVEEWQHQRLFWIVIRYPKIAKISKQRTVLIQPQHSESSATQAPDNGYEVFCLKRSCHI